MNKGADIDYNRIYRKSICTKIFHNLTIEKNGHYAHCYIGDTSRKSGNQDLAELVSQLSGFDKMQGVFLSEEMNHHQKKRHDCADCRSKSCSENTHITAKYKEIIAKHIEDTAKEYRRRCKCGAAVVSKESRQKLIKDEEWYGEFDWNQILFCQC